MGQVSRDPAPWPRDVSGGSTLPRPKPTVIGSPSASCENSSAGSMKISVWRLPSAGARLVKYSFVPIRSTTTSSRTGKARELCSSMSTRAPTARMLFTVFTSGFAA
jgi:hypothetical protein